MANLAILLMKRRQRKEAFYPRRKRILNDMQNLVMKPYRLSGVILADVLQHLLRDERPLRLHKIINPGLRDRNPGSGAGTNNRATNWSEEQDLLLLNEFIAGF
jgi:hypothetical protein